MKIINKLWKWNNKVVALVPSGNSVEADSRGGKEWGQG